MLLNFLSMFVLVFHLFADCYWVYLLSFPWRVSLLARIVEKSFLESTFLLKRTVLNCVSHKCYERWFSYTQRHYKVSAAFDRKYAKTTGC